jgi:C_GCAxxG_C_C family probable redox protein
MTKKQIKADKAEIAVCKFSEGYNCAQAVAYAFAGDVNIDKNTLMAISTGFGAGFGRKQEVCGAVSGAVIILGAKYGRKENETIDKTEITYNKVQKFIDEFTKEKGTIRCSELLQGCNLLTEEGQRLFKEKNMLHEICFKCVELSCNILQKHFIEDEI